MKKMSVLLVALLFICGMTAASFAQEAAGTSSDAAHTGQAHKSKSAHKPKRHSKQNKHHKKETTRKADQL